MTIAVVLGRKANKQTNKQTRTDYRVWDFGSPSKIQGRMQKCMPLRPENVKRHTLKIIVPCYLNSGMGSINIPSEDLSRHKLFFLINADNS